MRSISISQPVWDAIASRGKFGETEDDVLRRILGVPPRSASEPAPAVQSRTTRQSNGQRRSFATDKLSSYISDNELRVSFASGASQSWKLPPNRLLKNQPQASASDPLS